MITLIAAIDADGIIGDSETDGLPWHCPVDLERFRALTWGANCVAGRKTWDDMPDVVMEGRRWWVVTSDVRTGCTDATEWPRRWGGWGVAQSTMTLRSGGGQHFVIAGGASIYRQSLDSGIVDRAFLTRLPIHSGGDVEWPGLPEGWGRVRSQNVQAQIVRDPHGMPDYMDDEIVFEEWVPTND